jgi:CRISPR-associated endonuclease/helicase Cas3
MPNPIDRKNTFLSFKKQFYDYVISVPIKCLPAGFNENIYHISIDEIDQYYDPVTGFILDSELPDKTETAIF